MSFPNVIHGSEGELFHNSTDETVPVGSLMVIEDGRTFRFTELFSTVAVVNSLFQAEVHTTDQSGEVIDTISSGTNTLTGVGTTSSGITTPEYVNGYIYTDNALTLPAMRIAGHATITAGSTGTFTLYIKTPTDIAAANTVSYIKNPWRDVIIKPASAETAPVVGWAKVAIAADGFGWLQTSGPVSALYDSSTTVIAGIGDPVAPDQNVAGAISGIADGTPDTVLTVGSALGLVEGDAEFTPVYATLE